MYFRDIDRFRANPSHYVLQLTTYGNSQHVSLLKKGFRTWMKIHIGSLFGLFDKTTIDFQKICTTLENDTSFNKGNSLENFAIELKINKWNSKYPNKQIAHLNNKWNKYVIDPSHKNFDNFSYWNCVESLPLIANGVKNRIPKGLISTVTVRRYQVSEVKELNNVSILQNEIATVITLTARGTFKANKSSNFEFNHVLRALNGDVEGDADIFKKLFNLRSTIEITICSSPKLNGKNIVVIN